MGHGNIGSGRGMTGSSSDRGQATFRLKYITFPALLLIIFILFKAEEDVRRSIEWLIRV